MDKTSKESDEPVEAQTESRQQESELDVELAMDLPDHAYSSLMQHYR